MKAESETIELGNTRQHSHVCSRVVKHLEQGQGQNFDSAVTLVRDIRNDVFNKPAIDENGEVWETASEKDRRTEAERKRKAAEKRKSKQKGVTSRLFQCFTADKAGLSAKHIRQKLSMDIEKERNAYQQFRLAMEAKQRRNR